jgi:hypothetical protein
MSVIDVYCSNAEHSLMYSLYFRKCLSIVTSSPWFLDKDGYQILVTKDTTMSELQPAENVSAVFKKLYRLDTIIGSFIDGSIYSDKLFDLSGEEFELLKTIRKNTKFRNYGIIKTYDIE